MSKKLPITFLNAIDREFILSFSNVSTIVIEFSKKFHESAEFSSRAEISSWNWSLNFPFTQIENSIQKRFVSLFSILQKGPR